MKNIQTYHTSVILLMLLVSFTTNAQSQQKDSGVIIYERKSNWAKIYSRATFLSQEEKDRMQQTWKNDSENKTKMKLYFSPSKSIYTYNSDQNESEDGTYTWRQSDFIVSKNFDTEQSLEVHEMIGKTYILDDTLRAPKWRIMNQLKDINGYICMKAVTKDTVRKQDITAWFTDTLPSMAGPERYFGLPGVILELEINDGDVIMTAEKIEFKNVEEELKMKKLPKGKKIDEKTYNSLISKYLTECMTSHRFPWGIRY